MSVCQCVCFFASVCVRSGGVGGGEGELHVSLFCEIAQRLFPCELLCARVRDEGGCLQAHIHVTRHASNSKVE